MKEIDIVIRESVPRRFVTNFSQKRSGIVHKCSDTSIGKQTISPTLKKVGKVYPETISRILSSGNVVFEDLNIPTERIRKSTFSKPISSKVIQTINYIPIEATQKDSVDEENEMNVEEEKQERQQVPKSSGIGSVGDKAFSNFNLSALARSKHVKLRSKVMKKGLTNENLNDLEEEKKITLKETKSPDPFEAQFKRRETELSQIIASTASPDNPLYHLRQSGVNTPAIQKAHKHFVISLFDSIFFIQKMTPINEEQVQKQKIIMYRPNNLSSNKTVILDLDECLVHCVNDGEPADVNLIINLPDGEMVPAGVNIRPGVVKMLEVLSNVYEIFVFTASQKTYADKILDFIDKNHTLIHHRLYRENCIQYSSSIFIKDARILNRDLKNVIIVDNSPYAFASQIENGYPIIPYYDCAEDQEISRLTDYLLKIQSVEDVRVEIREKFKLKELTESNIGKYIQYYQPGNSDVSNGDGVTDSPDGAPQINENIKLELEGLKSDMNNMFKANK